VSAVAIRPHKADRAADHGDPIQSLGGSSPNSRTSLAADFPSEDQQRIARVVAAKDYGAKLFHQHAEMLAASGITP